MLNSLLSWLFIIAAGQALFLSVSLVSIRQPELRMANRLMATLLFIFAAIIGHAWLGLNDLYQRYPHSALAILTLGLATGPLLYLYLKALLSSQRLAPRELLHLLPFSIAAVAMMPFYLRSAGEKLEWMRHLNGIPWYLGVAAAIKTISFLLYVHASYRVVQRSSSISPLARRLYRLSKIWVFGGVLSIVAFGMEFVHANLPISADAVGSLALMVFVFATSFVAMSQPLGYRLGTPPPAPSAPAPKLRYPNNRLSTSGASAFLAALTTCMEQGQAFRNGELKLEELAAQIAMTPHELSQLINATCGMNFSDYLNRYRVEDLKRALQDPEQSHIRILDLALAAGFNSKSAMNRVFKTQTGMTPGEFRNQTILPGNA
jgi:AraC-like DNA-binding protein